MNAQVTALKCLAAATILVLSAHVTAACDDFDEEMMMAAAYDAAKQARSQAAQPAAGQQSRVTASAHQTGIPSAGLQEPSAMAQRQ